MHLPEVRRTQLNNFNNKDNVKGCKQGAQITIDTGEHGERDRGVDWRVRKSAAGGDMHLSR